MTRILAFDIGIKNLAWCVLEEQDTVYTIHSWDNYNLLNSESNVDANTKLTCTHCSAKATYKHNEKNTCVRHCSAGFPALRDLSGNLLKKIPAVGTMKLILAEKSAGKPLPSKKLDLQLELEKHFSLPIEIKKVSKAPDVGLVEIHNSIRKLILQQKSLWSSCKLILLENQPVFKNPTMKSVQILLFATLRDLLGEPIPTLKLVHAGKKVQGAESGDAGYKERKAGSEARVEKFLESPNITDLETWKQVWKQAKKKSDLADALCMCLDGLRKERA
jgi:hypothetical protein